jgi:uncharacterized repeat protein (TIGR01451 family)
MSHERRLLAAPLASARLRRVLTFVFAAAAASALLSVALRRAPSPASPLAASATHLPEAARARELPRGGDSSGGRPPAPDPALRARVAAAYGQLPLSFVANEGQFDREVKFSSRGGGYELYLTRAEAVLSLGAHAAREDRRRAADAPESGDASHASRAVLRMKLSGARREASASGEGQLPGRVNYLIGDDSAKWHTGVATFAAVRYEKVYPGVDVVYYGNQRQLEYDFIVAPHADPRSIRIRFEGARTVSLDSEGQLIVSADGGEVIQHKPLVYQSIGGARREVSARYTLGARREVGFALGEYDRSQPLVIDPILIYATFLGGSIDEQANAVAVDAGGNAYITGQTASANFPVVSPVQGARAAGNDAFVSKLNPAGTALVYSTYLGGASVDVGNGIAVDAAGSAYVIGSTASADFPHTVGAAQATKSGNFDAFVAKLAPDGSSLAYSTFIGGVNSESGVGIGVDAAGNAYVAGSAASPSINGTALPKRGSPAYKSADAGASWAAIKNGTTDVAFNSLTIDPTNSSTLYASGSVVYKSTDGGASWAATPPLIFSNFAQTPGAVTVDPTNPATLYATASNGLFKSTNGGGSWVLSANGLGSAGGTFHVLVDPNSPATLYAGVRGGVFKSTNGGASWVAANSGFGFSRPSVFRLVFDPTNPATIYAATTDGVFKSTNGAGSWTNVSNGINLAHSLGTTSVVADPASPSTLYAISFNGVFKTTNGGGNWSAVNNGLSAMVDGVTFTPRPTAIAIDPLAPATLYVATGSGIYKTTDGGANWAASSGGLANRVVNDVAVDRTNPANVYAATSSGSEALAAKIDPAGASFGYLVYLGGDENDFGFGIAVDPAGNAYLAGSTDSSNFPVANAAQPASGGNRDAFVAKLAPGGSVSYSTYVGGSDLEEGEAIAVDPSGRAYVTGYTLSSDFPVTATTKPRDAAFSDAFVTRLSASGSTLDYSILFGGNETDESLAIAADADGNAYVAGATNSTDFPTVGGVQACSPILGDSFFTDAFVVKLSPASAVVYATCVGGSSEDRARGIATAGGAAYVVGFTLSSNFPSTPSARQGALGGGTDAFVVKLQPGVDLALTMTNVPDPVALGGDLTYTINVANLGDLTATGVRLTDTLPAGATFVSATTSQGACGGAATITCDLGSIDGGAQASVAITIKPPAVRSILNTASVSANETEPNTANNSVTQDTLVDFADLSLKAAALQTSAAAGGRVTYLFAVSNGGIIAASNVVVDIALPAGVTFSSCTTTAGACGGAGNNRTVTLPSLAAGASQSFSVSAAVGGGTANGTVLTATAHAGAATPDPDPANNSASADVTVAPNVVQPKLNGKIAFTVFNDGLYVMNDDGTNPVRIHAAANGNPFLPAWSPDGSRIVFLNDLPSVFGTTRQLRIVNADGSSPQVLVSDINLNSRPTWSPDGASIAFIGRDATSIHAINGVGAPFETTLISNLPLLSNVVWSPDGTKFLYETNADLWTVNTDGSGQTPLSNDPNLFDTKPAWSPDGTKIMFLRRFAGGGPDTTFLYLMNADGTNVRQMPNFQGAVDRPVFSPDGQKIAFERPVSINGSGFLTPGILTMNADGTDVKRIPADGLGGSAPSWQPLPDPNPTPTPTPAAAFNISGRVLRADGSVPLVSTSLNVTGSHTASVSTDAGGNYSFTLPAGGNYTVTPQANNLFTYTPASRTFNNLGANQTAADFTATQIVYSISGRVTDNTGAPLGNIEITLNGGFPQIRTTRTLADGTYAFTNLTQNSSYSVFVSLSSRTSFSFAPDAVAFPSLAQPENVVNFVGTPNGTGSIKFSNTQYAVGEGVGQATITITRAGDNSAPATAQFLTIDDPAAVRCDDTVNNHGAAYARCDYATTVSTITFAPGVTQMTISVPVIDDAHAEGNETVQLQLFNGQGAAISFPSSATITIQDNDPAATPASANPVVSSDFSFFVRQQYLDFFGREPDPAGFAAWKGTLDNCPDPFNASRTSVSANCDRVSVSTKFFRSQEFELKGGYVFNFYRVALGRLPRYAEIIPDMASLTATNDAEFFDKKAAFTRNFVQRQEFRNAYDGLSNQQFVDALMNRYGVQQITTPDPSTPDNPSVKSTLTRTELVNRLNGAGPSLTRTQVLRAIADSNEVRAAEANTSFVAMQYFGYLRRDPDEGGFADWLRTINDNPADIRSMVNGFMNSVEYRLRFGTP